MPIYVDDYYAALKVTRDATDEQIKAAYRAAALKYHPDKTSDESAAEKFLLIQRAYEVLRNNDTRKVYDSQYSRIVNPRLVPRQTQPRPAGYESRPFEDFYIFRNRNSYYSRRNDPSNSTAPHPVPLPNGVNPAWLQHEFDNNGVHYTVYFSLKPTFTVHMIFNE